MRIRINCKTGNTGQVQIDILGYLKLGTNVSDSLWLAKIQSKGRYSCCLMKINLNLHQSTLITLSNINSRLPLGIPLLLLHYKTSQHSCIHAVAAAREYSSVLKHKTTVLKEHWLVVINWI